MMTPLAFARDYTSHNNSEYAMNRHGQELSTLRPTVRETGRYKLRPFEQAGPREMAVSLRLRSGEIDANRQCPQAEVRELRVQQREEFDHARGGLNEPLRPVVIHEEPMLEPEGVGVCGVRRAWDNRLPRMAILRGIPRLGSSNRVQARTHFGSDRHERPLHAGKLPLDSVERSVCQQAKQVRISVQRVPDSGSQSLRESPRRGNWHEGGASHWLAVRCLPSPTLAGGGAK